MVGELEVIARERAGGPDRPPLLFVHGAGHGAWVWDEHFLDFFADHGFDSYAMSLRGHGQSEGRELVRSASISDYVSDVRRVVAQLPHTPILVGHSLGARLVQKYLEADEAPAGVLLAPPPRLGGALLSMLRVVRAHPRRALQALRARKPGRMMTAPELFFSPDLDRGLMRGYMGRQRRVAPRARAQLVFGRLHPGRVHAPMLVLGAADDYLVPPSRARRSAAAYDAELKIIARIGHVMMLDARWREVADAMLEWLERVLSPERTRPEPGENGENIDRP